MLLTLLYHRVAEGKYANSFEMMKAHLEHISKSYPVVWSGDFMRPFRLSICLTFDDAYFDFYHYVFPLLKKYKLKAILAVPTDCIESKTNKSTKNRLADADYCTWTEIIEMHKSGLVKIASHSHNHVDLTSVKDLKKEILDSKKILEEKLQDPVDTFVYPYGKYNTAVHSYVKKHYTYNFRIGSAINFRAKNLLYRINADALKTPFFPTKTKIVKSLFKLIINKIRKK